MLKFSLGILFMVFVLIFASQINANRKLKTPPKFLYFLPLEWKEGLGWILFFSWYFWFLYSVETEPVYIPMVNTMGL